MMRRDASRQQAAERGRPVRSGGTAPGGDGVGGVLQRIGIFSPAIADDEKDGLARWVHTGEKPPLRLTAGEESQKRKPPRARRRI